MDSVLGRKQRIKNSDWIETFDKIEKEVEEGKYIHKIIKEVVRNGRS